jgi:hypothetical protein
MDVLHYHPANSYLAQDDLSNWPFGAWVEEEPGRHPKSKTIYHRGYKGTQRRTTEEGTRRKSALNAPEILCGVPLWTFVSSVVGLSAGL